MNITELLQELYYEGIKISIVDNTIKLKTLKNQKIPESITQKIKQHKNDVISFLTEEQGNYKKNFEGIPYTEKKEYYKIFSAQKGLYLLQQRNPQSVAYNLPFDIELNKDADKKPLEDSIKKLIKQHDSLRTSFEIINNIPVQRVHDSVSFRIDELEIEECEIEKVKKEFVRAFDLGEAPLLRVCFLKIKNKNSILICDMHHIINDGTSHNVLTKDFYKFYKGENVPLPLMQFKDFSEWILNNDNQVENIKKQEEYWLNTYKEKPEVLNLPTDFLRSSEQQFEGAIVNFVLTKEESQKVKNFINENGITLFMFFLSAFKVLLAKLSGQNDIIVGCPVAGRKHSDISGIVGMFVNALAIRTKIDKNKTIENFLADIKIKTLKDLDNQEYHFEELVKRLVLERDASRNPLFDVMFNVQNQTEFSEDISFFKRGEYIHKESVCKFDLGLVVIDFGQQLFLTLEYSSKLFREETINRFIGALIKIINQFTESPEKYISEIEILENDEREKILNIFNSKKNNYSSHKSILDYFEDQVCKTPDKIALSYRDIHISYKHLNKCINSVARDLINKGVEKSEIVGIFDDRSINSIVGLLGIIKAGAIYLPIDIETPIERILYFLKDSSASLLLFNTKPNEIILNKIHALDINLVDFNQKNIEISTDITIDKENFSHIIYTSGSTGFPKGVLIKHSNVINLIIPQIKSININEIDKILLFSPLSFDASVEQIWLSLLSGAELILVNKSVLLDYSDFQNYINNKAITCLYMVPAYLNSLNLNGIKSLKKIVMGGEVCNSSHVKDLYKKLDFYNEYGPTEVTVTATRYLVKEYDSNIKIPIGKPIENKDIYIFDDDCKMLPIGIVGEMHIGGFCVSEGYLNNVELTADKFIRNPNNKNELIYKTGDLAKWLSDGNIEFAGRKDEQVKIRGFRVEIGEIQSCLLKLPGIYDAVVVFRKNDNEKFALYAYIVADKSLSKSEIRVSLSEKIPNYMIPNYIELIDRIPLTINGKIDIDALPQINKSDKIDIINERSEFSDILHKIWGKVLNLKNIYNDQRFFELGGDSLKAMQLSAELQKLNIKVTIADLMKYPTISELCNYIESKDKSYNTKKETENNFNLLRPTEKKEYYCLSYSQKYFLKCLVIAGLNPNVKGVISLNNPNKDALQKSIYKLVAKHENLRTNFIQVNGELKQKIQYPSELIINFEEIDLSMESDNSSKLKELINSDHNKPFNIAEEPLLRMKLFRINNNKYVFCYVIHHLLIDIYSTTLFGEELQGLYLTYLKGQESSVSQLKIQYKDYSEWISNYFQKGNWLEFKKFWSEMLLKRLNDKKLGEDLSILNEENTGLITFYKPLRTDLFNSLCEHSRENNYNIYSVLLAAMNILISKLTHKKEIVIRCPVACRQNVDVIKIIGFVSNELFLFCNVDDDLTLGEYLKVVNHDFIKALNYQLYPSLLLANDLNVSYEQLKNDIAPVTLNHHKFNYDYKDIDKVNTEKSVKQLNFEIKNILCLCHEYKNGIILEWAYSQKLYSQNSIKLIEDMFIYYLQEILKYPEKKLGNSLNSYR